MSPNILVTGAAGYVGGSLVADLLTGAPTLFEKAQVHAAVRSEEQAQALSKLGINVLQLDLADEKVVIESLLELGLVVHTASSLDPGLALPLITALGRQKEISGEETYFIHTSGLSAFCEGNGWPHGTFKDTGPVFDVEKELADSFPLRKTDVTVTEHAKDLGVTSFIVIPSVVYGKGTGEWNKLSVVVPLFVAGSISSKKVYKFPENTKVSGVHISDLTALYKQIIAKILSKDVPPNGTEGYYFALAHDLVWWEVLDHLVATLDARGLVTDSKIETWPSDKVAAQILGVPEPFVQVLFNSGEDIIAERPHELGWRPRWDKERFLKHIGDEIDAVLELGEAKSSLVASFKTASV